MLLVLKYGFNVHLPKIPSFVINLVAWLLAGHKVLTLAFRKSKRGDFFNEFVLMSVALVYTPIVFFLALAVCTIPFFIVDDYVFTTWFYMALVFLLISCPCALVVSIPLCYFGGIGLASRNGILFKGGNFLDVIANVNTVVMDKTGTLTKGVF